MARKMNIVVRLIYALVGVSGIWSLLWAFMNWAEFSDMTLLSRIAFMLLVIGGINWGIVSITGKRNKDLFGMITE